jgi:hypothetical protein
MPSIQQESYYFPLKIHTKKITVIFKEKEKNLELKKRKEKIIIIIFLVILFSFFQSEFSLYLKIK